MSLMLSFELAQLQSLFQSKANEKEQNLNKILSEIKEKDMAPYYKELCIKNELMLDEELYASLKSNNEKKIKELDEKVEDCIKNRGDIEVKNAFLLKAEYLSSIGDKDESLKVFTQAYEKTTALGQKLDLILQFLRIGLFYMDHKLIISNIAKAQNLLDQGVDWDRKNRFKAYKAVYEMSIRNFSSASSLYLETLATFTSYELMPYITYVKYAVLSALLNLSRTKLRDKVIKNSEVLQALHQLPLIKNTLFSIYECRYRDFFQNLAELEEDLKFDRLFCQHYRFYIREMRMIAYSQMLESFKSLSLSYMADTFKVSTAFVDKELSKFISSKRLKCKIDKVNALVHTTRLDSNNKYYQETIKNGDVLLNRIQKLERIVNI